MMDLLPSSGATREIVISTLIVIASVIVAKLTDLVLYWIGRHVTTRTRTELDDIIIDALRKPIGHAMIILGLYIAAHRLVLAPEIKAGALKIIDGALYTLAVAVGAWILWRVSDGVIRWYTHTIAVRTDTRLDDEFAPLIGKGVKVLIVVIAAIIALDNLGINVNSFIVSLGVGSLAIALAAKDTLANMIAGIVIMVDRPFRVGDRIVLSSGETGDVFNVGFRSTKILTFDNTLIVVPNALIVNEKLTNLSYPDPIIRVRVDVGVAYGTDLEKAKAIMVDTCKAHPDVLKDPEPQSWFIGFGDSSLDLSLFCRVADFNQQWRVGEELRLAVRRRFQDEGIEIPLPQQVVHLKEQKAEGRKQ